MSQGRDSRQIKNSYKIAGWSLIGFVLSLILIFSQS